MHRYLKAYRLIFVIVVGGLFLLFTNKTFVYDTYKNDNVKEGIPISRFMYVRENNCTYFYRTEKIKNGFTLITDDLN